MPSLPTLHSGSATAGDPYIPTSGNGGYLAEHYDLALDYRVATNRLNATAIITARATGRLDRFSLDCAGLSVDKVTVNGVAARKFTHTARKLVVTAATTLQAGVSFEILVRYRGAPHPVRSAWGEVGWEELDDGVLVSGQPIGAQTWFPCNDHPSNKATYRISVSCESGYTVISNGTLVSQSARSGRTSWTFYVREPVATYLATVAIGRYRRRDLAASPVAQSLFFPADHSSEVATDFGRLGEMITFFSDRFGPYPFSSYSVVVTDDELEIPLEAHGLAVFGRNHADGVHGSDRLIAHELAHQWYGNSLTVSRWQDIWLHEGFACYAEWLWEEQSGGRSADQSARAFRNELNKLPKDLVVGDPGPRDMFDDRVYKRGALTLHAIRVSLGDEAFFSALSAYTQAFRHGHVTTDAFITFFAQHTGSRVIGTFIDRWIFSASLPSL
ncbi:M1 family metallopeptidase [Cryobacterium sp. CG_9.6]|uniref:M1 family metallopeptidase n=1 Tax=Cryobacterium sp. CG_9.6 TaxID=2760710 RepID=UPI0024732D01|nr:M1 family metallopeptidase [Cryobacterium sp. CG_9.6]MDH6237792.1 aminopeptidase N [Cryobacterium sp. CG_9.6]